MRYAKNGYSMSEEIEAKSIIAIIFFLKGNSRRHCGYGEKEVIERKR